MRRLGDKITVWLFTLFTLAAAASLIVHLIEDGFGANLWEHLLLVVLGNETREWAQYKYLLRWDSTPEGLEKRIKLVGKS